MSLPGLFDDIEKVAVWSDVMQKYSGHQRRLPGYGWYDYSQLFVRFRPVEHEYGFPHFLDFAISINSG